jgi:hypothetical protein
VALLLWETPVAELVKAFRQSQGGRAGSVRFRLIISEAKTQDNLADSVAHVHVIHVLQINLHYRRD